MSIRVDIEKEKITMTTLYSEPPVDKKVETYQLEETGLD